MEYIWLIPLILFVLGVLAIYRFMDLKLSIDFKKLRFGLSGKTKPELDSESATLLGLLDELGYSRRERDKLEVKYEELKRKVAQLEEKHTRVVEEMESTQSNNVGILVASDEEQAIRLGGGSYSRALQALDENDLWGAVTRLERIYSEIKNIKGSAGVQRQVLKLIVVNLQRNGEYSAAAEFLPKMKAVAGEDWETMNLIGLVHKKLGNFEQSEKAYRYALKLADSPRSKSLARATVENNLGNLFSKTGDYPSARFWLESSLDKLSALRPLAQDKYITTLNNLGAACEGLNDVSAAEGLYRQALDEYESGHLLDHDGYASVLNNLAFLYSHSGREQDAVELFTRSLDVMEREGRRSHPNYGSTAFNLADLLWFLGEFEDANKVLDIGLEFLGEEHLEAMRDRVEQLQFSIRNRVPSSRVNRKN